MWNLSSEVITMHFFFRMRIEATIAKEFKGES